MAPEALVQAVSARAEPAQAVSAQAQALQGR